MGHPVHALSQSVTTIPILDRMEVGLVRNSMLKDNDQRDEGRQQHAGQRPIRRYETIPTLVRLGRFRPVQGQSARGNGHGTTTWLSVEPEIFREKDLSLQGGPLQDTLHIYHASGLSHGLCRYGTAK